MQIEFNNTTSNLKPVSLEDKYTTTSGRIFINGVQALVRLPLAQKVLDIKAGLNTAGYISGYRGSPLGGYDAALWRSQKNLAEQNIIFQPGVNEDLAATAVWGTQQLDSLPSPSVDGVFALWYGKGPGVDRAGDPFKHGNYSGSHRHGGVLLVYGDDHPGKSSTVAHQSEQALAANSIPSLYPSSVKEYLEFGLLGWALSRYSGLWIGFKAVNETVEQTATIDVDLDNFSVKLPEPALLPEEGVHYRPGQFNPQLNESLVQRFKLPLVHQFVRANGIDRVTLEGGQRRLGIVTAGKTYEDVVQALQFLGVDDARASALGLSVYKVGCIWPLEPEGLKAFAQGQEELLFVEEKKPFLEEQAATILYNDTVRPRIVGKLDESGKQLLPSDLQLEPGLIARVIAERLHLLGVADIVLEERLAHLRQRCAGAGQLTQPAIRRTPFFCSGCSHNTSIKLPEGSFAMSGIGCHGMAIMAQPNTLLSTQMGGEGANWAGLSHFTNTNHIFQNLGDGTYYHSGLMAIRGAVASGVNITYKILFNDAVAMTGGQPVDGPLSVGQITHQVLHEGAKRCVVVTDTPSTYNRSSGLAPGVSVVHRDQLDHVQQELREIPGCTVLIYEQTCAAEKRRRRKRGSFPDPAKRLFINEAVCEGCNDCSTQSSCVSLLPKETALGRKRKIDQIACNKDYSCVKGSCPSFVTVYGGELRKPHQIPLDEADFSELPQAASPSLGDGSYGVMIAGIGGTGVITVGALLGMAAHLEGKACSVFDMTGLSQKNGAVYSHLRIAKHPDQINAQRLGFGDADLVLGFDLLAAVAEESQRTISKGRTRIVGNSRIAPTAMAQKNPDIKLDDARLLEQFTSAVGENRAHFLDATGLALALCGDTLAANLFMVGYAVQKGLLPMGVAAIVRAIELNGVAVSLNLQAFRLGRLWAHAPEKLAAVVADSPVVDDEILPQTLEDVIAHRTEHLTAYQNKAYARRYRKLVDRVVTAERQKAGGKSGLGVAAARYLAKLMAYKDEYEVARLYSDPAFMAKLRAQFDGKLTLKLNLAPPLFAKRDRESGRPIKREFGRWMLGVLKVLAKFKSLRGTKLDLFGYTAERRQERQLIQDYECLLEQLVDQLTPENHALAVQLASLPERIRGFGHIKERHVLAVQQEQQRLFDAFSCVDQFEPVKIFEVSV